VARAQPLEEAALLGVPGFVGDEVQRVDGAADRPERGRLLGRSERRGGGHQPRCGVEDEVNGREVVG